MAEKTISLDENNLNILRDNLEKRLIQSDLRKKFLGGISEEDVTVYVESVKHQFQLIESALNKQIIELQVSNEVMRRDFEEYRQRAGEDKIKLQEALKNAVANSLQHKEEFSEKDEIINKMNESFNLEIYKLTQENLRLEKQLMESKNSENSKVAGVKSGIDAIYSQLDILKNQVGVNDSLQQQLEAERLRSEKTEKEMYRLREWVAELKERCTNLADFCNSTGAEIDNMHAAVDANKI